MRVGQTGLDYSKYVVGQGKKTIELIMSICIWFFLLLISPFFFFFFVFSFSTFLLHLSLSFILHT